MKLQSQPQPQRRKWLLSALVGAAGAAVLRVHAQSTQAEVAAPPAGGRNEIVPLVRSFSGAIRKFQDIKPLTGAKVQGAENQSDLAPLIDTFVGDLDIRYAFDAEN